MKEDNLMKGLSFEAAFSNSPVILMEGAIGERLKREFGLKTDGIVALAEMVYQEKAREAMMRIYQEYVSIADTYRLPFMVTTPTRRANKERVSLTSYHENIISDNVSFLKEIRNTTRINMNIGGLMGCKGDAYKATEVLSVEEAYTFHSWQADLFQACDIDFLYAGIMPALSEAVGMARAMEYTGLPYIISFMIKENGKLPDGTTLSDAIQTIDSMTLRKPLCYMSNCIHPKVLQKALLQSFNAKGLVMQRFMGIQANASCLSPEELDNSKELKTSDSISLAEDLMELNRHHHLKIIGGCCGTNNTHIEEIAKRMTKFSQ